jgi:hypothetical protein
VVSFPQVSPPKPCILNNDSSSFLCRNRTVGTVTRLPNGRSGILIPEGAKDFSHL